MNQPTGNTKIRAKVEEVTAWWLSIGFQHVRAAELDKFGLRLPLSCSLLNTYAGEQAGVVSSLVQFTPEGEKTPCVLDNDANRAKLFHLIRDKFPKAEIVQTENQFRDGQPALRCVIVLFRQV